MLLSLVAAFAEDTAPKTDTAEPDEVTVVVTAERRLQPVSETISTTSVVTAKQIQQSGAQTAADAIRLVPGVTIRQSGSLGSLESVSIRGSSSNQVLVLVDGQRISSPAFFSGTDLSKFPVQNIARIEVIRGPASALYGSEAFGGVINIITKQPGHGVQAVISDGSHDRRDSSLTVQGPLGKANWMLSAGFPQYGGFRPNSDFAATDLNGKVILADLKGWTATLVGETYQDKLGLPGADPFNTGFFDPNDHQWWDRHRLDLTLTRPVSFGDVEIHAYQNEQRLRNLAPPNPGDAFPSFSDSVITGKTNTLEALVRGEYRQHSLTAGAEYRQDDYKDVETGTWVDPSQPPQVQGIHNKALFAQDHWAITSTTDLVMGARLDDHSTAGSKVTPRVGVTHRLLAGLNVRASYAEGFRAPNFVELYYPEGSWGPGYSGNPSLKPETSRQYEFGMNRHLKSDDIDLAVFTANVGNLIFATSATPYENIGHSRQKGAELNWQHRFTKNTALDFSYTYTDARNTDTGVALLGKPFNKASLTASTLWRNWNVGLTGRWVDDRQDLAFDPVTYASSQVKLPDYTVFDLTLARQTTLPIQPYFTIRNLLNRRYDEVAGYRAEGFGLESGVRMMW